MIYTFSHNDIQENAQQTKDRTANANPINKVCFIALLGQAEVSELIETMGTPEGYYQKDDITWASIGNIDYVFKSTNIDIQAQDIIKLNDNKGFSEVVEVYDDRKMFLIPIEGSSSFEEIPFNQVNCVYRRVS